MTRCDENEDCEEEADEQHEDGGGEHAAQQVQRRCKGRSDGVKAWRVRGRANKRGPVRHANKG